jgi:hypothetical protein
MPEFHMTFGVKYGREPHPTLPPEVARPDGWLTIVAPDFDKAYRIALGLTLISNGEGGQTAAYSDLRAAPTTPEGWASQRGYFPRGETCRVTFQLVSDEVPADYASPTDVDAGGSL